MSARNALAALGVGILTLATLFVAYCLLVLAWLNCNPENLALLEGTAMDQMCDVAANLTVFWLLLGVAAALVIVGGYLAIRRGSWVPLAAGFLAALLLPATIFVLSFTLEGHEGVRSVVASPSA